MLFYGILLSYPRCRKSQIVNDSDVEDYIVKL